MAVNKMLIIDDGSLEYEIRNKQDKLLGSFRFNPADAEIAIRAQAVVDKFNTLKYPEPKTDAQALQIFEEFSGEIHGIFNTLLGYDAAPDIFAGCSALTVMPDGDFFFEKVMAYVLSIVTDATKTRIDTKLKKIHKATNKYRK